MCDVFVLSYICDFSLDLGKKMGQTTPLMHQGSINWQDLDTFACFRKKTRPKKTLQNMTKHPSITSIKPNQTGLFGRSKDRGGWINPKVLMRSYAPIFHPNSPEMVSKDIWHIHSSIESLKTILWFRIFPQCGSKVTSSQGANSSAFRT